MVNEIYNVFFHRVEVHWFHKHGVCQMIIFITYVCGFLSVWLVVMVTVENYIRICHPHQVHALCTPGKARVVLLVLGITSIFSYNFPLWTTQSMISDNTSYCSLISGEDRSVGGTVQALSVISDHEMTHFSDKNFISDHEMTHFSNKNFISDHEMTHFSDKNFISDHEMKHYSNKCNAFMIIRWCTIQIRSSFFFTLRWCTFQIRFSFLNMSWCNWLLPTLLCIVYCRGVTNNKVRMPQGEHRSFFL